MTGYHKCPLGEIVYIKTGKLDSNFAVEGGKYPFFTCSPNTLSIDTYAFDEEAILLAGNNAEGKFTVKYYDGKFNAYQRTYVITPKDKQIVDCKYLSYVMRVCLAEMRQLSVGTSTRFLTRKILDCFEISLPPLPVQKKIAAILSSLDDKIELNTRMNKVLEEIARALFHRWFVEFEFPNAEGKPYKSAGGKMVESEMGSVPEGWKVGTIGEITKKIFSGGTPNTSKKEYWNGEIPWFSSGETRCHFVIDTEKTITKDGIKNSSTKLAKKHDIVIASAGQGFTRGQTSYLLLDTYVNQSVIVIHSEIPYQIYVYMSISGRYDELRGISDSSSIRGSLTTKMIDKFPIFIPSFTIVEDYAKIIQPIINRIENNLNENKRLTNIRDALLPKLMSGEIEV